MRPTAAQARIVARMGNGARLSWSSATACFQLVEGPSTRTIQGRTVEALDSAGLIVRDVVGDCVLSSRGARLAASSRDP